MAVPIDPLPERELCQYEKIRDDIIREREEAMAKCKYFDDLQSFKKEIGFYRNVKEIYIKARRKRSRRKRLRRKRSKKKRSRPIKFLRILIIQTEEKIKLKLLKENKKLKKRNLRGKRR